MTNAAPTRPLYNHRDHLAFMSLDDADKAAEKAGRAAGDSAHDIAHDDIVYPDAIPFGLVHRKKLPYGPGV